MSDLLPDETVSFELNDDGDLVFRHRCVIDGFEDDKRVVTVLPIRPEWWSIVSVEPLTVRPSIHCRTTAGPPGVVCGLHGFITEGKWITA